MALEQSPASFRLGLQSREVGVQLLLGNTLAPLQLFDAGANLGVVRLAVGRQPFILLVQHFEGTVYHVVGVGVSAGAQRLSDAMFLFGLQLNVSLGDN